MTVAGWMRCSERRLSECESTNDVAAAWAREGAPHGAVVIADRQRRGRGRLGRLWHSPPEENLYFSAVLRPPPALAPMRVPPITLAAGVAVAEAATDLGVIPSLKWPNDLLCGGKKVAGILAEMASAGARVEHVILGIGVNLNGTEFPPPLDGIATSLRLVIGQAIDREAFTEALCTRLGAACDAFFSGGPAAVLPTWRRFATFLGERVSVQVGEARVWGRAVDVDADGALQLVTDEGAPLRVIAGDLEG
jgi:BirA family biotin operon repressor/biotin-[acetyl-CoA-carboxylase] ligase